MASKEHKELANFIKTVHHALRSNTSEKGFDDAWEKHCSDEATLKKYAEAMHLLAVNFWDQKSRDDPSLCRILWVFNQCIDYFKNGGRLKFREKEQRLASLFNLSSFSFPSKESNGPSPQLKLLDVGSCYNPFKAFTDFQTLAIDLMPATEDVLQCDFLKVAVNIYDDPPSLKSYNFYCKSLPKQYFDIVVFSLFLEYIPSSVKRYECCSKAQEILKPEGILVILTPDSSHESANSKLLRSWRLSLAKIGFLRVLHKKLRHLHGLVFRKCIDPEISRKWLQLQSDSCDSCEMLAIPQDFSDFVTTMQCSSPAKSTFIKTCDDEDSIAQDFSLLPNICFED